MRGNVIPLKMWRRQCDYFETYFCPSFPLFYSLKEPVLQLLELRFQSESQDLQGEDPWKVHSSIHWEQVKPQSFSARSPHVNTLVFFAFWVSCGHCPLQTWAANSETAFTSSGLAPVPSAETWGYIARGKQAGPCYISYYQAALCTCSASWPGLVVPVEYWFPYKTLILLPLGSSSLFQHTFHH